MRTSPRRAARRSAPEQVMDGVADVATEIRLEVLLEEGSRLVVLREPFGPATRRRSRRGPVR